MADPALEIPGEIVAALHDTLTARGLDLWWTNRNGMLSGFSPAECWTTLDNRPQVAAAAWALRDGVFV